MHKLNQKHISKANDKQTSHHTLTLSQSKNNKNQVQITLKTEVFLLYSKKQATNKRIKPNNINLAKKPNGTFQKIMKIIIKKKKKLEK